MKKISKNVAEATFKDFCNKSFFPFIIEFSDNYDHLVNVTDVGKISSQMNSSQVKNTRKKTLKQGPRTLFKCFFGTQLIFSCSKSTIQTLEKGVKYVPS